MDLAWHYDQMLDADEKATEEILFMIRRPIRALFTVNDWRITSLYFLTSDEYERVKRKVGLT